jgi:formamidopyrimidine-DNA glycosylase
MPELPEVETITQRLKDIVSGKTFADLEIHHPKSFGGNPQDLVEQTVRDVTRRAKYIRFHLKNGLNLVTHLKMTGQLIYIEDGARVGGGHPTADWTRDLPSKHTRIAYTFADGSQLFFNDQRIFGWMRLMDDQAWQETLSKLGPDINDPTLSVDYLQEKLSRRSIPIKQAIMHNPIVCGIGNIYACDILNKTQIDPFKPSREVSRKELESILEEGQKIINRAIELGGTTFDGKYVNVDGMSGGYQDEALAYGRENEHCFNCGSTIIKKKIAGRGTYFCPNCQK